MMQWIICVDVLFAFAGNWVDAMDQITGISVLVGMPLAHILTQQEDGQTGDKIMETPSQECDLSVATYPKCKIHNCSVKLQRVKLNTTLMYQAPSTTKRPECIPVGCVPPAAVAVLGGVCLSACWETTPPPWTDRHV